MMRANSGGTPRLALVAAGLLAGTVLAPASATAQSADAGAAAAQQPSGNAMINLVRLLVAQGTITRENGDKLIAQAIAEADQANAAARAAQAVPGVPSGAATGASAAAPTAMAAPPQGTMRVPYIPQVVRDQIRDELRADVMKQAKAEGWASADKAAPEWTERLRLFGDFRIRSQSNLFSKFNSTQLPNFQAIVAAGPLDLINNQIPFLNTTVSRYNQLRYRLRLGAEAKITNGIKVGIQLASGNDAGPVATASNLAGGLFKRNLYLQQAYIEGEPTTNVTLWAGRFENPFWTTEALYDNDLMFDGVAAEARFNQRLFGALDWTVRAGAFPLDFGGTNFPDTATSKLTSPQKWLFAGQLQGTLHLAGHTEFSFAAGWNKFLNLEGRPSEPCALYLGVTQCSSDQTAAFYVQKGNSLSFIRRIVLDPSLPSTTVQAQPQLLGLTQPYTVLDLRGQLSFPLQGENRVTFGGEYLRNLAFRKDYACRYGQAGQPVNNGGSGGSGNICDTDTTKRTPYVAGNQGYSFTLEVGRHEPWNFGEWRAFGEWRSLESDAVLDAFTNDEFHLGGTNARGFILGAQAGLFHNTNLQVRWFSANQITGEPLAIDEVMIDLNARF
ncbi:putative porin [Novosphingobium sp.]|uniref:putative porin n=1 Tax=Novosphingobium sp. TaxID=1874826 RepID=UPI003BAB85AF